MSLKCLCCGYVNFQDAQVCKRCGNNLQNAQISQPIYVQETGSKVVGSGIRISERPSWLKNILFGGMLIMFFLIFGFIGLHHHIRAYRCSSTTEGLIAPKYYEETRKYFEIPTSKNYMVTYRFMVRGREYTGQDRISKEPHAQKVTVYYNPKDPGDNLIEPQPFHPIYALSTLGAGIAGAIILLWPLMKRTK